MTKTICKRCGGNGKGNFVLCPFYKYEPICMAHCYNECKKFDRASGKCLFLQKKTGGK
nr:MAG TPA: hypothetical protein [Caudoviricetes sp.]